MALGMSMWCPYEGFIPPEKTLALVARLRNAGIRRFYLAGSMGMENPRQVNSLFRSALERHRDCAFGYHVHNLSGMGTANVLAALDAGASSIEGAICGIGGGIMMPTSMGSVGNHPSEDIVAMLNEMGIDTGIETEAMIAAARDVAAMLGIEPRSFITTSGTRAQVMEQARSNPRYHPG
jgi:hydroxymethylglutaryl-CoA lyase